MQEGGETKELAGFIISCFMRSPPDVYYSLPEDLSLITPKCFSQQVSHRGSSHGEGEQYRKCRPYSLIPLERLWFAVAQWSEIPEPSHWIALSTVIYLNSKGLIKLALPEVSRLGSLGSRAIEIQGSNSLIHWNGKKTAKVWLPAGMLSGQINFSEHQYFIYLLNLLMNEACSEIDARVPRFVEVTLTVIKTSVLEGCLKRRQEKHPVHNTTGVTTRCLVVHIMNSFSKIWASPMGLNGVPCVNIDIWVTKLMLWVYLLNYWHLTVSFLGL